MKFRIYRYDPEQDAKPLLQEYDVALDPHDRMLLDALIRLKAVDDTLSFRRSCREGVCGSDAMNINGKNGLACITNLKTLKEPVELRPLPGLPVIRDLIVDMSQFFKQYHSIKPYLVNDTPPPERERLQSPAEREELDGLYECILCACCSTACPSFWWNPDKFVGPAGLLAGLPIHRRQPRPRPEPAARQPRGSVPPVPLPHDHELRRRLSEEPQSDARDREDQGSDGEASGLTQCNGQRVTPRDNGLRAAAAATESTGRNTRSTGTTIDDRRLNRIRWRCRRGMLENDLVLARFLARMRRSLTEEDVADARSAARHGRQRAVGRDRRPRGTRRRSAAPLFVARCVRIDCQTHFAAPTTDSADRIHAPAHEGRSMTDRTATLNFSDGAPSVTLPVLSGTIGPDVIDIRTLYAKTGKFTYDPGFMSTAACSSAITYIDGDKGELLYRGYPIEELAVRCDYLETCYLLLYGELPTQAQKDDFVSRVINHTMVNEQMQFFMRGFRRDAHPMAVLTGLVGAMSRVLPGLDQPARRAPARHLGDPPDRQDADAGRDGVQVLDRASRTCIRATSCRTRRTSCG